MKHLGQQWDAGGVTVSPPARGRGLKQRPAAIRPSGHHQSPPARGRGLKPFVGSVIHVDAAESPPARGRGLKHDHLLAVVGMDEGRPPHGGAD